MKMSIMYCPTNNEVYYYDVDYSFNSVKKLIKDYYNLKTMRLYSTNFELVSIIIDLDMAIANCGLTDKQKETLLYYAKGYTESEIGVIFNTSRQNVNKTIAKGCSKIAYYLNKGDVL